MDQICFLNDFPAVEEERFYKEIATDASGNYTVYAGGTYVFFKNTKGLSIRFTTPDIKSNAAGADQIEAWLKRIRQMNPGF